jgi:hypothetical protein
MRLVGRREPALAVAFCMMVQPALLAAVQIVVDRARRGDAGVAMALGELDSALNAPVVYRRPGGPLPNADVVLVGRPVDAPGKTFQAAKAEQFRIAPDVVGGRQALVVGVHGRRFPRGVPVRRSPLLHPLDDDLQSLPGMRGAM